MSETQEDTNTIKPEDLKDTPVQEPAKEAVEADKPNETTAKVADAAKADEAKTQSREKDHEYAEKRREAEAKAKKEAEEGKIRQEAELKGKLSVLDENPYTKKPIKDEYDLKMYEAQKKLDREGKDPINDLADELANEERERKSKAEQEQAESKKTEEKANAEAKELLSSHPEVDAKALMEDQDFLKYADDKFGRWTLKEIYEGFKAKSDEAQEKEKEAQAKAEVKTVAKTKGSAPSAQAGGSSSPKDLSNMSYEEFKEYERKKSGNYF
jgi:hypothetical protein